MEDVETEQRIGRKRRKLTTRQGVVIGVATVAGLSLVSKLVSFLRREKPKKVDEADIRSLKAVVSGDAAKPSPTAPKFANLEDDDATDSSTPETDGSPDLDAKTSPTPHSDGDTNAVPHPSDNGDAVQLRGEHHNEDEVALPLDNTEPQAHVQDTDELPIKDAESLPVGNVGKLPTEDIDRLPAADVEKLPTGALDKLEPEQLPNRELGSEVARNSQVEDAQATDAVESHSEDAARDAEKGSKKQANGDVENLDSSVHAKPFIEESAANADNLDADDAPEPPTKDTESEDSVQAHREDDGKKLTQNPSQNGENIQS